MACTVATRKLLYRRVANIYEHYSVASYSCASSFLCHVPQKLGYHESPRVQFVHSVPSVYYKHFTTSSKLNKDEEKENTDYKKLTLFQKFKQMYRDYWYVLVPVHVVTSVTWFGSFYYVAKRYEMFKKVEVVLTNIFSVVLI